VPRNKTKKQ